MSGKGLGPSSDQYDGAGLRVGILHARWNKVVVDSLVNGAVAKLKERGVTNIVVQTVPGSYELPLACAKMISASQIQANATAGDLLGETLGPEETVAATMPAQPFDAVIAIGTLIKGATMHFEYISDAVTHALMKVQLDSGTPVVFGVLTALTDEQALERAGLATGADKGHNHGEDWGLAAVEMGVKARGWAQGKFA